MGFMLVKLLVLIALLAACQSTTEISNSVAQPTDSPQRAALIASNPDLQTGQAVYELRCAHCHGYSGEGQLAATVANTEQLGMHTVPPHNASGHTWKHSDQLLRQVILNGIENPLDHFAMPPFEGAVSETEIDQLIAYIRLWWTDDQRAWQSQVTERHTQIDAELGISLTDVSSQ